MQLSTTKNNQSFFFRFYCVLAVMMLVGSLVTAQETETETEQDSTITTFALGKLKMPNPNSIISKYTYDPILDLYILSLIHI